MVLSNCAIGIYFLASFPIKDKKTVQAYLLYGYVLTLAAMIAMVMAFVEGLQAVLYHSSLLENATSFILPLFWLLFLFPGFHTLVAPSLGWIFYTEKVNSFTLM